MRIQSFIKSIDRKRTLFFVVLFFFSLLVLFFRREDALLHAQFWAEDGNIWFQAAYNSHFSLTTIFQPYAGYLGVFPRFIAELSWLVGIENTPLFFNSIALVIQTLPVLYLWSKRCEKFVPNRAVRVVVTLIYLCLPYTAEIHATITNSQWFLALLAFMLLFSDEAKSKIHRILDNALLLIATLSGPFCIFLIPIGAAEYLTSPKSRGVLRPRLFLISAGMLAQLLFIAFGGISRVSDGVGFSITQLFTILGGQVFGGGFFGEQSLNEFSQKPWITPLITILGVEILIYMIIKGPRILKYFIIFAGLIFSAALFSPPGVILGGFTWWQLLAGTVSAGGRYYFLLHLAIFTGLVWLLFAKNPIFLRFLAGVLISFSIIIGFRADYFHKAYKNYHYHYYMGKFERLKKGAQLNVPINPGSPWQVHLTKN